MTIASTAAWSALYTVQSISLAALKTPLCHMSKVWLPCACPLKSLKTAEVRLPLLFRASLILVTDCCYVSPGSTFPTCLKRSFMS